MSRLVFGLLGLLVVLAVVGKLAGQAAKGLGARPGPAPAVAAPASGAEAAADAGHARGPAALQRPQHYQKALEEALQQGRARMPDDAP